MSIAADEPSRRPLDRLREGAASARHLAAIVRNPLNALPDAIYREPIVFSRIAGRPRIFLADPTLIHDALVANADALDKGNEVRRALGTALGRGLLTADGAHWKWQRRSVAGAFRHEKLLELQPTMIAAAERTRLRWSETQAPAIDVGHEMVGTTFDIIVGTMLSGGDGIDVAGFERGVTDYAGASGWMLALSVLGAPEWTPYPGRAKARAAVSFLRASLAAMVAGRRRATGAQPADLVTMLLDAADPETGRSMTDAEIVDNLLTFVIAGHETTALGLAWTFHLLARHPEYEARVLAEIAAVTGGKPLAPEHIARLVYTRQVFFEAMRLYPPAPIITRTATEAFRLGTHSIAAGSVLTVPIYAVHRHATLWERPEAFDPSRFDPAAEKTRHRCAFMPFGAGPRVCIGSAFAAMEAVAILGVLLPAFRLREAAGAPEPEPAMKLTLRPRRPLRMTPERRRAAAAAA